MNQFTEVIVWMSTYWLFYGRIAMDEGVFD